MAFEVVVPPAGESIQEGMLVEWSLPDGALVRAEEPLFVLETDKVTLTVNAPRSGRLTVKVAAGEMVKIGQVVGAIDENQLPSEVGSPQSDARATPTTDRARPEASVGNGSARMGPPTPVPPPTSDLRPPTSSAPPITPPAGLPQMRAKVDGRSLEELSPSVRRMVTEHGLDPARIGATGKGGRLTKEDIVHHLEAGEGRGTRDETRLTPPAASDLRPPTTVAPPTSDLRPPTTVAPPTSDLRPPTVVLPPAANGRQVRRPMSPIRQRIAERMLQSQATTATLTTFNEADLSALLDLRKRHREAFKAKHGVDLGFLPFFVKAVVEGLEAVPSLRTMIDGAELVQSDFYDIGIAVAADHGLAVPVVRDADQKSLGQIQGAIEELAKKVREKRITLSELQGGVFSITNAGSYGALMGTPILNPPQSGILGMYTIQERPVAREGKLEIRPMMYLALSYDHRIVDGKDAGTFLKKVAECVADPARYSLELE